MNVMAMIMIQDQRSLFAWFAEMGGFWRALYFIGYFTAYVVATKFYKASLIEDIFMMQERSVDPNFTHNPTEHTDGEE